MKNPINQTLNEVFSLVATGVDYASNVAKELNKSIPVVYRQLEVLVGDNVIKPYREGKRVLYKIQWQVLNTVIADQIEWYASEKQKYGCYKELWKKLDQEDLREACKKFFLVEKTHSLLKQFLECMKKNNKQEAFAETIFLFCQSLGKNIQKTKKRYDHAKQVDSFLEFCKLIYEEETTCDIREIFSKSL